MSMTIIDGSRLRQMILTGATLLEQCKTDVDALNVFPVPDGDTGTNMSLTMANAVKEVQMTTVDTVSAVSSALSKGALKGARGNSGVILSQLFRGFAKTMAGKTELTGPEYAAALQSGVDMAYKAIMKPQEGTILTVSRMMAAAAVEAAEAGEEDVLSIHLTAVAAGEKALARTPDLLPVLKQAGVVDAGGKGWLIINYGFTSALKGEAAQMPVFEVVKPVEQTIGIGAAADVGEILFGYCTEYIVETDGPVADETIAAMQEELSQIGDCVVVVGLDSIIKVHTHSNDPGLVVQVGIQRGSLTSVKIENMREQHQALVVENPPEATVIPVEKKPYGIVAVAAGEGIQEILRDLQVDAFVEGGQTMNPSAEDIAKVIKRVPAETVFVLPNNSNIILAAQQAAELVPETRVILIPSKTIPQGMSAILAFSPEESSEANEEAMKEALSTVKTGQITYAVRDTVLGEQQIRKNDYLALFGKQVVATDACMEEVMDALTSAMVDGDTALITLYYGDTVEEDEAQAMGARVAASYPDCDVSVHFGGQPVYYYIVSAE